MPVEKPLPIMPKPIAPKVDPKVAQLHALALELGYYVQPSAHWMKLLATQISIRLTPRVGKAIYQFASFNLANLPLELAKQIFWNLDEMPETPAGTTTWRATTSVQTARVFGSVLQELGPSFAGASRALSKPSESVSRVVATIMPRAEFSYAVTKSTMIGRLYVTFMYAHPPQPPSSLVAKSRDGHITTTLSSHHPCLPALGTFLQTRQGRFTRRRTRSGARS